jgi:hypothetical protein
VNRAQQQNYRLQAKSNTNKHISTDTTQYSLQRLKTSGRSSDRRRAAQCTSPLQRKTTSVPPVSASSTRPEPVPLRLGAAAPRPALVATWSRSRASARRFMGSRTSAQLPTSRSTRKHQRDPMHARRTLHSLFKLSQGESRGAVPSRGPSRFAVQSAAKPVWNQIEVALLCLSLSRGGLTLVQYSTIP